MTDSLFNPEAFEQMPGQMSMEAVESTFGGKDAPTCSECERSLTECDCIVMETIDIVRSQGRRGTSTPPGLVLK